MKSQMCHSFQICEFQCIMGKLFLTFHAHVYGFKSFECQKLMKQYNLIDLNCYFDEWHILEYTKLVVLIVFLTIIMVKKPLIRLYDGIL
jgi:hypothetical protein